MFIGRNHTSFGGIRGSLSDIHFSETQIKRDITTRSGDIKLVNCCTVGRLKTTSGDVDLDQGSIRGQISTERGNISTDNTHIQGRIETASGEISLSDSHVEGNIQSEENRFSIHRTKVTGTLTATGVSLRIGSFSYINKVVMHAPRPGDRRISRPNECQTIFLGTGTQVRHIEFEAARCRIVLGPHAEYLGSPTEGMSIEREGHPAHSTAQAFNSRFNPRPQAGSSISQRISLPDAADFSQEANIARRWAMDKLLDTPIAIAQTSDTRLRRSKMGEIGGHYIDALHGKGADKLQSDISALDDKAKAKTLTAIIYGTLSELGLDNESKVCKALEDLCKEFKDRAGMIRSHIKTIDGRGISGSGLAEDGTVRGGIALLNQPQGRLPYATEMMLYTLGLGWSENQKT